MKTSSFKSPVFLLRILGSLFLAVIYISWRIGQPELSPPAQLASLVSLGLFWGIGWRFAPILVQSWTPGSPISVSASPPPRRVLLGIFFSLILFCAGIYLWVFLLRRNNGTPGSFEETLSFWTCLDSGHYLDIARDWYLSQGNWDRLVQLVFLPGYPLVIRLATLVTGDYLIGAIAVSWLAFAASGCLLYLLVRLDCSHSTALWSVIFLCLAPGSFFFAAPMSESLFLLLCLGCLYLARTGHWWIACLLGGMAAFTRTLAVTLVVPLLFELIMEFTHPPRHGLFPPRPGQVINRLIPLALVPLGFGLYCFVNYQVSGNPFQFLEYQRVHWGQESGYFFNTASYQIALLLNSLKSNLRDALGLWLPNVLACLLSMAVTLFGVNKLRPSYTAWFMVYFYLAAGATWLLSAPRYMVAFFPLSIIAAQFSPRLRWAAVPLFLLTGTFYLTAFALRWQVW